MFGNPVMAAIGFLAIVLSTAEFWLPIQFRLDQEGAQRRLGLSLSRIEWSDVRRVLEHESGFKLSPLEGEGRLDPFRGLFVRTEANHEEVRGYIQSHVSDHVRFLERRVDGGGDGNND